jgi:adhesin/invasin
VGVLLVGGLLAGPCSSSAMADGSLTITLTPSTILANGTSTTDVEVDTGTSTDDVTVYMMGGQQVSGANIEGDWVGTITSTKVAGTYTVTGADGTTDTTVTATLTQVAGPAATSAGGIYWGEIANNMIWGASLTGGNRTSVTLGDLEGNVNGLAVGAIGPVYIADPAGVGVAPPDLSGSGTLEYLPDEITHAVAVDPPYVYWLAVPTANEGNTTGMIGRANLDGSDVDPDFISPAGGGYDALAVDSSGVYWTNEDSIGRANLDGSDVNQNYIATVVPEKVTATGPYLYWIDESNGASEISRAYVGGGVADPGVDPDFINDPDYPIALAVDGSYLYWTNLVANPESAPFALSTTMARANLDGSDVEQSFMTGLDGEDQYLAARSSAPTMVLSEPSIAADGTSTSTATMTVTDQFGNPVSGDDVTIASSDPSQQVGPVTNPSPGIYQATITSTSTPGTATITGTDSTPSTPLSASATLTETGPPAQVAVALAPGAIVANGSSTSVATATVTDQAGNGLDGQTVTFASSGGQSIGAVTESGPGAYQATITSSKVAGAVRITATDHTPSTPLTGTGTLTQTAGPATHVALALSPASILANGSASSVATATVTDQFGNPVSGDTVTIASNGGQHVAAVHAGAAAGTYQATISSTTTPGAAVVTATDTSVSPSVSGVAALVQSNPAEHVTLTLSAPAITTDHRALLTLGSSFTETATLGPLAGIPAPSGTVKFNVYAPSDPGCAAPALFTSSDPVNSAGTEAVSGRFTPKAPGTYRVVGAYSGDESNSPVTTKCGSAGGTVLVSASGTAKLGKVRTIRTAALARVSCSGRGPCAVTLALVSHSAHRTVSIGHTSVTIAKDASETIKIPLNKAGLALLRDRKHHHLTVELALTQIKPPTTTRTITFA